MKEIKDMTLEEIKEEINRREIAATLSFKRNRKTQHSQDEFNRLQELRKQRTLLQQKAEEEARRIKQRQHFIHSISSLLGGC